MGNKLYVGNLPYGVRDNDLEQAFSQFGAVTSARVMMERDTGRSKGFGFVEMGDRKSTRLNSSHLVISYAVFCLKKKKHNLPALRRRHRTKYTSSARCG